MTRDSRSGPATKGATKASTRIGSRNRSRPGARTTTSIAAVYTTQAANSTPGRQEARCSRHTGSIARSMATSAMTSMAGMPRS